MKERGLIRALVAYNRSDFFFDHEKIRGFQAEVLREYEAFLNKGIKQSANKTKIVFVPVEFEQLIPALLEGKGDIAAAFLTITPEREKRVAFVTGGEMAVSELLVTNKSVATPTSISALSGQTVHVLAGSSYAEHLRNINKVLKKGGLKSIKIEEADRRLSSGDILELVNAGAVKMTVVDDYRARLWAQVLPNIRVHEEIRIAENNQIGWAVRPQNTLLIESLKAFTGKVKQGSLLGNMLMNRYFKDTRWVQNPTTAEGKKRLEKLIPIFSRYAEKYEFDRIALLAQAYQESGLDQNKKSHRGAIGIMQMLPSTAADSNVNIADISRLENNIHAGTKYLAFLRERYFNDSGLTPENQLAFSLAAYNAGPAKVRKMRTLTEEMGLDPDQWLNNVEVAAGKITGKETVDYVANILKYYVAFKLSAELRGGDLID
ncbi:MAG: lytic transglycosylase F [Candidatus Thiodiazotropha sp.]